MNSRERFNLTLAYGRPDRPPLFEEGMRDEVWEAWRSQGVAKLEDLYPYSTFDHHQEFGPELRPIPALKGWPDPKYDLKRYQRSLDVRDRDRLPKDWHAQVKAWKQRDYPLFLQVHDGFFLTLEVGEWASFIEVIRWMVDEPDFVHGVMEIKGEFAARMTEKILKDVEVDAVIFSEPIGGNHGPLISPRHYEEFVMKSYLPLLDVVKQAGVKHMIMRTYANERVLLPVMMKYGINVLWACETDSVAMDYVQIRKEFGRDLSLIGGIDTDALRSGEDAIHKELNKILPLLDQGGFIPLADGRVREDFPLNHYLTYRKLLENLVTTYPGQKIVTA